MSPRSDVDTSTPDTPDTHTTTTASERAFDYSSGQVPVRGAAQEVANTASRRSGPRRWLRAVEWLIAAGLHGRANATTLTIARDLATRMDYDLGHARYCLDEMAARLGMSRATIKRHISYLRELGALAWVQHGTRTNIRQAMGLKGYAATATIYAAVIPASYDHAMGHRIIGSGYTARIIVDLRGRAPKPVDNPPVENPGLEGREPPSLNPVEEEGKLKMVGGSNYTSQARQPKTPIPHQSSSINGRRRTADDVRKAAHTTRLVRALVNWTQKLPLRRLEYVLRPWTDQGWDALRIVDELQGMCAGVRWKPNRPDHFIRSRQAADTAREELIAAQEASVAPMDNQAWADLVGLATLFHPTDGPVRTAEDRAYAQLHGWSQWEEVADHYADDPDDAIDLYGVRICKYAIDKAARREYAHV